MVRKNHPPKEITVYCDGASRGNPGIASCGFVMRDTITGQEILKQGTYLGEKTNNQAEYTGLLLAIRRAKEYKPLVIHCFLDSELVTKQMRGEYKVKNSEMKRLHDLVVEEMKDVEVDFSHVLRHLNSEADAMANYAIEKGSKVGDTFIFRSQ